MLFLIQQNTFIVQFNILLLEYNFRMGIYIIILGCSTNLSLSDISKTGYRSYHHNNNCYVICDFCFLHMCYMGS